MPTFQFYSGGKKVGEFSGADSRRLYSVTSQLAEQAEKRGTYVRKEVTKASLETFYEKHDPSKISDVPKVVTKYGDKTAKLVRLLRKKYGAVPTITPKREADDEAADNTESEAPKGK